MVRLGVGIVKSQSQSSSDLHVNMKISCFVYVDAEKYPESRKLANVSNLPTFASFRDGQLVEQSQGNKIETIEQVLNAVTSN